MKLGSPHNQKTIAVILYSLWLRFTLEKVRLNFRKNSEVNLTFYVTI